ncbi:DUF4280 domain-containing protein [Apibacter muscae]|uniref:PAAR-like protein n=1 Tax=Apibacter muscae TaxID=2509004 RepID=UPI0011ACDE41|nr:PAAR-like protein [Apibacter muscae]TWP23092.1 DUF4280 domain-containing protein [Apibacter muscae]
MSKSYIPKDTYVVCTYQENTDPKKLIPTRNKVSVFYKKDKALLTVEDKNTNEKFICKKPMNLWMAIAGLAVGLILASNPIGWAVAGICAVVLIAGATIAIVTHDCSSPLKEGKWINYKTTVYFNGYEAITQESMLTCKSGGVLQPMISYDVASQAAKSIAYENIKETAIITAGAIASGYLLGKPIASTSGSGLQFFTNSMRKIFGAFGSPYTYAGIATTYAMSSVQSSIMRGNDNYANNEIYQRMNEAEKKDYSDVNTIGGETYDTLKDNALTLAPPTLEDAVELYKTGQLVIQDEALLAKFRELVSMSRQQLNSETARNLWSEIKTNPNYQDVYDSMRRNSIYNQNRITPTMRYNGISHIDDKLYNNKWSLKNENSLAQKSSAIALFFVPLASGYFSENARRKLAETAIQDATNSISVITKD